MIRLKLLGGFDLQRDDVEVVVQPAAQRLLAFLALSGAAMERSFTAFRLWPDKNEERAKANLRSTVWRLRGDQPDLVTASRTHLRLQEDVWVDVCDGLDTPCDPTAGGSSSTVSLHDDLLPDWYDDWLTTERERVRQVRLHALEAHGHAALEQGRVADAIQLGLRAIAIEPLRESAHRLVIEAHVQEGNLADALRQFDHCATVLARDIGAVPSSVLIDLIPERCRAAVTIA